MSDTEGTSVLDQLLTSTRALSAESSSLRGELAAEADARRTAGRRFAAVLAVMGVALVGLVAGFVVLLQARSDIRADRAHDRLEFCHTINDGRASVHASLDILIDELIAASSTQARPNETPEARAERERRAAEFVDRLNRRVATELPFIDCETFVTLPPTTTR